MGSGWVSGERTPPPSPCERAGPSRGRRGPRRRLKSPEADSLPGPLGGWAQGCWVSRRLEMLPRRPQAAGAGSSVHTGFSSRLRESGSALCAHGPSCRIEGAGGHSRVCDLPTEPLGAGARQRRARMCSRQPASPGTVAVAYPSPGAVNYLHSRPLRFPACRVSQVRGGDARLLLDFPGPRAPRRPAPRPAPRPVRAVLARASSP